MADYHSLLMRAVANLPNAGTPATRGAIYGRAEKALLEQLRSLRPPLPESDIAREEKALDAAIAEIEGRYGSQDAGSASRFAAPAAPRLAGSRKAGRARPGRRSLRRPRRRNPPPSSAPARLRRPGHPPPRRDRLRKRERQANPGAAAAPVQGAGAATSAADARDGAQPAGEPGRKRQPRLRGSQPRSRRRRRLRRLDPSWLLRWAISLLYRGRPGRSLGRSEGRQG